jgi:hypothetical protein
MKTLVSAIALGMLLGAAAALAADLSGTWAGTLATQNGDYALVYTFKQEGAKLTGTLLTPQGDTVEIQDGKVDGDKVSFVFEVAYNGGMKFLNEGAIKGDEIAVTTTQQGTGEYGGTVTLKRQK